MNNEYAFMPDDRLSPGWAMINDPHYGEVCFAIDDWSDDPDLIGPEVGVIFLHPDDLAEMLEFASATRH